MTFVTLEIKNILLAVSGNTEIGSQGISNSCSEEEDVVNRFPYFRRISLFNIHVTMKSAMYVIFGDILETTEPASLQKSGP